MHYICGVKEDENTIRQVIFSDEFTTFFENLDAKTRDKYAYVIQIMRTQYRVSEKFVKKLQPYEIYEIRVSVRANEYRSMLVTIDNRSFMEAKRVVLLNSFLKKDTKQYRFEIAKALVMIKNMEE
jgi:hypothetical protein